MRSFTSMLTLLMLCSILAFAQTRTVTGVVRDDKGEAVPFATVTETGTQNVVRADANGAYTIKLSPNGQLTISATGFTPQTLSVTGNTANAALVRGEGQLQEVVVTALGVRRQRRGLGYSVEEVKGDQLNRSNNQNVVNSLNGRVSGVQVVSSGGAPGQASRIVIRGGAKSITGDNEPLFVIDGVPVSNANDGSGTSTEVEGVATPNRIADINPEDIESMSILKGSAAAVLYGNRGANGVVLITTKSGRGRAGVPVITYSGTVGFDDAIRLPDFQKVFAQGTDGATYREGVSRSFGPRITGQTVFSNAAGKNVTLQAFNPREDFLETGVTYNNNVSIAQSRENTNYYLSLGHSRQQSIVPEQDYNKASIRLNINNQITTKFNAGVNLNYVRSWGDVPDLGQSGNNPFFALFNMPVSWDIKGYGYQRETGEQINFRGGAFDNPLWTVNKTFFNTIDDRFIGALNLGYKILPWLDVAYRLGLDQMYDDRKSFKDINTGSFPNGNLYNDNINRQNLNSTFFVNINRKLNSDIGLTFTGGHDYFQRRLKNYTQTGTSLVVPGVAHMTNVQSFDPDFEYQEKKRLVGIFGDLKFDYRNFLFLGLTARNEWSSTLPEENRSYFFPGVNASVIFTDLFNIDKSILSYGKLRAGYAQTARDPDPYQVINTYVLPDYTIAAGFGDGFVGGSAPLVFPFTPIGSPVTIPGYTLNNVINNPDLKAETTSEFEVGTELRFLKERINLDFTYFHNTNKDGIVPVDISPAAGATNFVVNSGKTTVQGIEVGLNVTPIKSKSGFTWNANITFSRIRSKVEETYPGVEQIYLGGFSGNPAIFAVKGERYGTIIGEGYQRDANGNILVNDDGEPLYADGLRLGHVEPDWTGGIRNTLTFKNFALDFLFDTRQGGYIYNGTEELLDFYGVSEKTVSRDEDYIFPGVKQSDGKANDVVVKRDAVWWGAFQGNEEYVYENNWLKLREANLSYNFKLNNNKVLKSGTVSLYGRNLWIDTDVPHVDPESSSFGTGNGQGATRMSFPTTRSYGLNLRLTF